MGGDGGSIPKRADMVRTSGYKFARNLGGMGYIPNTQIRVSDGKFNKHEENNLQWSTCAISQEKLRPPIVACQLGQLYNKEVIMERLLSKTIPKHVQHIRSLRDIITCHVEMNPKTGFLICPISKMDLQGSCKGIVLKSCGCVLSKKSVEAIPTKLADGCLNCGKMCLPEDAIPLFPDKEELETMKVNLKNAKPLSGKKRSRSDTSK